MSLLSDLGSQQQYRLLQYSCHYITGQYRYPYSTVQYSAAPHRTAQHSTAVLLSPQVNLDVFFV